MELKEVFLGIPVTIIVALHTNHTASIAITIMSLARIFKNKYLFKGNKQSSTYQVPFLKYKILLYSYGRIGFVLRPAKQNSARR